MDHRRPTDEQLDDGLLARLRSVAIQVDAVPEEAILAARSMLAHLRLDAELAELTFDSSTDDAALAGVRSMAQATRLLTFEAGATQVEIEIVHDGDGRRLIGQCLPATQVEITVRHKGAPGPNGMVSARTMAQTETEASDAVSTTTTDDLGRFAIEVPAGLISLRCAWTHIELAVETAWVSV